MRRNLIGVQWPGNPLPQEEPVETFMYSPHWARGTLSCANKWRIARAYYAFDKKRYMFLTYYEEAPARLWCYCYWFAANTTFKQAVAKGRALADMLAAAGEFDLTENSEGNHRR